MDGGLKMLNLLDVEERIQGKEPSLLIRTGVLGNIAVRPSFRQLREGRHTSTPG